MKKITQSQAGFGLIGIAILILAVSFLVTGGLYLMQNYNTIQSDQKSVDYTRGIEEALQQYASLNGRYPCPAPLTAAPDAATFGKEASVQCNATATGTHRVNGRDGALVRIGAVPVRTLGLPDRMIADGHGKRYVYAITESLTKSTADVQNDLGAITITGQNGQSMSDVPDHVVYALMSPSEDDRGAYDLQGTLLQPCDSASTAGENCDFNDAVFVATMSKSFDVNSESFTHSFAFHANKTNHRWHVDPWGDCNGTCFTGNQTRNVTCRDDSNTEDTTEDACAHTPKPDLSRGCYLPPCQWDPGAWDGCSGQARTCGGAS